MMEKVITNHQYMTQKHRQQILYMIYICTMDFCDYRFVSLDDIMHLNRV